MNEIEQLIAENKRLKQQLAEIGKSWDEIQRLKDENEIRDNLSEKFRKEALSWANIANEYQKDKTKLEQTLQEIKAIAEKCDLCDDCSGIDDCERYCGDSAEPCATRQMNNILEIINKAKSEGYDDRRFIK